MSVQLADIYKKADPDGSMTHVDAESLKKDGGAFLVVPVDEGTVFCREKFSEEHRMFDKTAREFGETRILPHREDLNKLNKDLTWEIFREMGELGFLGVDVPEKYDGMELDKTTSCIVAEGLSAGRNASILTTASAHTGISMLPIVWYGNDDQKQKYLPKLATGEWMAAYALTEPGAGSDALAGKATATLNEAGTHYLLNGTKIYITNGSWANVIVTFANIEGKGYTGFILEKDFPGFIVGAEEKKMGIKGSSTTTLFFENCEVPVENMLGEPGQGGPIAFNVLYVGRYKLGVVTGGGAKYAIETALEFANEREQFNRPISEFGMLQKKFADMMVGCWETDCLNYMTAGSIDDGINPLDKNDPQYFKQVQKIIEDHGIEASLCKVLGSEVLAKVVDDCVQIYGGAGFIEEYPFAVMYRDERINRIFEGTNEINRMIIGGTVLKKAILEEVPIRDTILKRKVQWNPDLSIEADHPAYSEAQVVEYCRSLLMMVLDDLILYYGQDLKNQQWDLEPLADMVIGFSIMDTGFKRYNQIDFDSIHGKETLEILQVSVAERSAEMIGNAQLIWRHILPDETANDKEELANQYFKKLNYHPKVVDGKKAIMERLQQHKKYYLDQEA